ncbi:hypothetical protein ABZ372_33780, partial [Streptomyces sp. NPDC005921]
MAAIIESAERCEEGRGGGRSAEISTPEGAANDAPVVAFGRLRGAANRRLECILGRSLERECGTSQSPTYLATGLTTDLATELRLPTNGLDYT